MPSSKRKEIKTWLDSTIIKNGRKFYDWEFVTDDHVRITATRGISFIFRREQFPEDATIEFSGKFSVDLETVKRVPHSTTFLFNNEGDVFIEDLHIANVPSEKIKFGPLVKEIHADQVWNDLGLVGSDLHFTYHVPTFDDCIQASPNWKSYLNGELTKEQYLAILSLTSTL